MFGGCIAFGAQDVLRSGIGDGILQFVVVIVVVYVYNSVPSTTIGEDLLSTSAQHVGSEVEGK